MNLCRTMYGPITRLTAIQNVDWKRWLKYSYYIEDSPVHTSLPSSTKLCIIPITKFTQSPLQINTFCYKLTPNNSTNLFVTAKTWRSITLIILKDVLLRLHVSYKLPNHINV